MIKQGLKQAILTGTALGLAQAAAAQSTHTPARTEWGDPDLRGTWPMAQVADAGIPLERAQGYGDRLSMTDEEFARRLEQATASDASFDQHVDANGTAGLAAWLQSTPFGRRTSLIVDPANGRLPPLTPEARALYEAGRNSFKEGHPIDWITDLDAYDRCITRGLPANVLPWPNNNGVRVFQSPGFVVLQLEVLGTRIIPIGHGDQWPVGVRSWSGRSRGHWEGETLVIETEAMVAGDSASTDVARRAASPLTGRGAAGVVPMSERARTVERLTMTGPDTIKYVFTYSDPDVYTAPWTAEVEWSRDEGYGLYEFACHEGNTVRDMIAGSRLQRRLSPDAPRGTGNLQADGTGQWAFPEAANVENAE